MNRGILLLEGFLLFLYLLIYLFSNFLFGEKLLLSTMIKAIVSLSLVALCWKYNIERKIGKIRSVVIMLLLFVIIQLVVINNISVLKVLGVNILFFYLFSSRSCTELLDYLSMGMKVCSLICASSVLIVSYMFQTIEYLRDDVIIDKSFMTFFFSFTFVFTLVDIRFGKQVIFNYIVLILVFLTNIMIVQSKISIAIFIITILIIFFLGERIVKKRILRLFGFAITLFIILVFSFPDLVLPDDIKFAINTVTGQRIFTDFVRAEDKLNATYNIREDVWNFCLNKLFVEHPLLGIGIGNFPEYAKKISAAFIEEQQEYLTQTESSLISIITEGGILYLLIMIRFFSLLMRRSYYVLKELRLREYYYAFLVFLSYSIMIIGNDFLDSMFWIQTGLMAGIISPSIKRNALEITNFYKNK